MTQMTPQLNAAFSHFGAGRYEDAVAICQKELKRDPKNPITLEIIGTSLYKSGKIAESVEHLKKALSLSPKSAQLHNTYGCVLKDLDQIYDATMSFQAAIGLKNNFVSAHFNLALCYLKISNLPAAITELRKTIGFDSTHDTAKELLAEALFDNGDIGDARILLIELFKSNQSKKSIVENLVRCEAELGNTDAATKIALNYIDKEGPTGSLWLLLGNIHYRISDFDKALDYYKRAEQLMPASAILMNNIATTLDDKEQFREAIEYLTRAIAIDDCYLPAYVNLAQEYLNVGEIEPAKTAAEKALSLNSESASALIAMGTVLNDAKEYKSAGPYFQRALRVDPQAHVAWYNYGNTLHNLGHYEESATCFENALKLSPTHGDTEFNLGMTYLCLGQFEKGWRHWFKRYRFLDPKDRLTPISPGMSFNGKRVYFIRAQGLGDELFYLRFLHRIKEQGAWIAYKPGDKLLPIVSRLSFIDHVVDPNGTFENADHSFGIDDLPLILDVKTESDIDAPLKVPPLPERLEKVKTMLAASGGGPYTGITWRAGTRDADQKHRRIKVLNKSISIESFCDLIKHMPGKFIVLQRRPEPSEIEYLHQRFPGRVIDCSSYNDDLEDMLALLALLDDQFGVSNTNVHLRAAVGKTGLVLVTFPPEWRWMRYGDRSPWFPGFFVERQDEFGKWPSLSNIRTAVIEKTP